MYNNIKRYIFKKKLILLLGLATTSLAFAGNSVEKYNYNTETTDFREQEIYHCIVISHYADGSTYTNIGISFSSADDACDTGATFNDAQHFLDNQ